MDKRGWLLFFVTISVLVIVSIWYLMPGKVTNYQTRKSSDTVDSLSNGKSLNEDSKAMKYIELTQDNRDDVWTDNTVLFFHASWCPTCRIADKEFMSTRSEKLEGYTVIKVDYDAEKELKNRYGVEFQHTFVQINSSGDELNKWIGGGINKMVEELSES